MTENVMVDSAPHAGDKHSQNAEKEYRILIELIIVNYCMLLRAQWLAATTTDVTNVQRRDLAANRRQRLRNKCPLFSL